MCTACDLNTDPVTRARATYLMTELHQSAHLAVTPPFALAALAILADYIARDLAAGTKLPTHLASAVGLIVDRSTHR
jgi:hypothetical protein